MATASTSMIVAYDKGDNHHDFRNVLFVAFNVEKMSEHEFQQEIAMDNELRREMGLPEKPADE